MMTESTDKRLSRLIGVLYEAAAEEHLWSGMATRIAETFDSNSAVVKLYDSRGDVSLVETTGNMMLDERQREWSEYWHRNDLWVSRTVALGMSRVITDEDLVSKEEQQQSAFYHEWLRALDIHHVVGATFPVGDGLYGALGIHRSMQIGSFESGSQHRATLFLPHLQRALQLGRRLGAAADAGVTALDALDRIETGVIIVDLRCRIIRTNALAEELLRSGNELGVSNGRLFVRQPALQNRLAAIVRDAVATAVGKPQGEETSLAIPREDCLPLTLAVSPLAASAARFGDQRPRAMIFLRDPEHPGLQMKRLRDLFDFTVTEAAIAAQLGCGLSINDIAARRGVGIATIRTHIKKILAKTGTRRQAEVAALLARSVAAIPG